MTWVVYESDLRGGKYFTVSIPDLEEPIDIHEEDSGREIANLISAAPDMLDALEAIELARTTDRTKDWLKASKLSDAAIKKAKGE